MARRTIDPETRARVVQRGLSGESTSEIAADEGLDPKTVRNYLRAAEDGDAPSSPRRQGPSARSRVSDDYLEDDQEYDDEPKPHWIGVLAIFGIVAGLCWVAVGRELRQEGN
jgi:predicted transcriptional regulator